MTAAACACGGVSIPALAPERGPAPDILLHLPGVHCAACIADAERALAAVPGVASARVNLGMKRALVRLREGGARPDAAALVAALGAAGIPAQELDAGLLEGSADRTGADLLLRLGVAFFAMMNVLLLSVAVWSGAAESTGRLFHLLSALITVPTIAFAARPFFVGAIEGVRAGRLGMDFPISLAILLATLMSLRPAFFEQAGPAWFDAALSLTFFLLAGRYLDHRGRAAARSAARALAALDVPRALRLTAAGEAETVPTADLRPGDRIRVLPGMRAPADGVIEEGASDLDRSAMTGESAPAFAGAGAEVLAGETVLSGALVLRVTRAGRDTTLARMTDLVAEAEAARGAYLSVADRAVRAYVPGIHAIAAATFAGWLWATGDGWLAAGVAVAVLVITCPCALGLAVPAVSVAATGRLFRDGLLVKNRTTLERLAEVDTVAFDKTGTLTTGTPAVDRAPGGEALAVAAALAGASSHPLSRALAAHAAALGVAPAPVADLREVPGEGVEGLFRGERVRLGRGAAGAEATTAWLTIGTAEPLPVTFRETLRPGAARAVAALREMGLRVVLLSGDAAGPVARIAAELGIDDARAGLRPDDKVAVLRALAAGGARVLMVGDGMNDTAALAAAHVAISPGSALDAPRSAADVVLLAESLFPVPRAIRVARTARARMRENLGLALAYNLAAVPLAVAGLATPLIASLAMSSSSLLVSLNAARMAR